MSSLLHWKKGANLCAHKAGAKRALAGQTANETYIIEQAFSLCEEYLSWRALL